MRKSLSILFLLCGFIALEAQSVPSPKDFIGDSYGEQFNPHHLLVDYFNALDQNSNRMKLVQYGQTNEGRPLILGFISSEENIRDLENIQKTNLFNAGLEAKPNEINEKAIVWLSYSVHGNEAGGSEAAYNVAYQLLKSNKYDEWLKNTVVIIDPSLNPDGYSRYTHWVRGISGKEIHPEHTDVEHMEPWPGGRVNHYLFDLNRDWAWQTQVETQQRIQIYNQWMPHIHADLHEMGYDDHYYFAPAAEPFHKAITDWQRELQTDIGKNHAGYFDQEGWLYFTREIFDLLYPSYGDTWPTFNGSIGMTYEQAGHGMSGRAIKMSNGKNLTLQDRIDHHTTTSLSTIEVGAIQKDEMIRNFKEYFKQSIENPIGKYKYYLVKDGANINEFKNLLRRNGIEYETLQSSSTGKGFAYHSGKLESYKASPGDVFISAYQAKSTLLQVLMEVEPELADSVTYDITSWSLPYAYNLKTYGLQNGIKNVVSTDRGIDMTKGEEIKNNYGHLITWDGSSHKAAFLGDILESGIHAKTARKEIKLPNTIIKKGDIVILRGDQKEEDYSTVLSKIVEENKVSYRTLETGFSIRGSDLGGSGLSRVEKPKVLTFFGNGVNANAYGQIWHYFENQLDYALSRVDIERLGRIELDEFNTIILPDGYYSISENNMKSLIKWVRNGGKLISIRGANRNLKNNESFALHSASSDSKELSESERKEAEKRDKMRKYEGAERRSIAGSIPGAIFKTEIDNSHPLCYGMETYYTLKNSSSSYPLLGNGAYNPVRIPENYSYYGFVGSELENHFTDHFVFAVESMGRGKVIYMADNPLFRAFWKSGETIMANALFQVH